MSAVLMVRLKITDLTAWTALEAGRKLLPPGHTLERVLREQVILFEPEPGTGADAFEAPLADAVKHSNFFVNPNKESYRFLNAAERGEIWTPPQGAWGILARAREDTRDEGLRQRLLREHPLQGLRAIRRAKVWWLWTRGPDGGPAVESCARALGILEGRRQGLLVNPHFEAALVLDGPMPWSRVESFLIQPAPAYRAAA
jgi:hypothetical protein